MLSAALTKSEEQSGHVGHVASKLLHPSEGLYGQV